MTLLDFFTLTEMNNGLTVPSRVTELMGIMQKDKDSILKNVGDSTKQWSAVASVIAATENTDCLDLFIQLDGLDFIDKWLKDAQKLVSGTSDTFVEDSITHLLRALEKLHVDYQKLVASEIWTTVKDLHVHNSSKVQYKAKELYESWKRKKDIETSLSDVEKVETLSDNEVRRTEDIERACGHSESSPGDASLSRETSVKEKGQESTRDDSVISTSSDVHSGQVECAHNMPNMVEPPVMNDKPLDHIDSPSLSKPAVEPPLGTTSIESCNPAVSRHNTLDGLADFNELEAPSDSTQIQPEKLVSVEESKTSCSDAVDAMNYVHSCGSKKNCANGDKSSCNEGSSCIDSRATDSEGKGAMSDSGHAIHCISLGAFTTSSEKSLGNPKDLGTFPSGVDDDGKINKHDLHISDLDLANNISKVDMIRGLHRADNKSDVELDYGIVDPLELARQVAIEVERDIGDNREQSCSSPEKLIEGARHPDSPNYVSVQKSDSSEGSLKEVANESGTSTGNLDTEQTNRTQDMETSSQEEVNAEKGLCNFDLNQEVCSEGANHLKNQSSTPVSIVSASRAAAAATGLPVAPLQFKGNLGWKGSAATSAFYPASKQQIGCLDFDLNVSESADGRMGNLSPDKHVPLSLTLPSMETNSRKSEHLELDLNLSSEDGGVPLDWRIRQLFPQANGQETRSYSSPSLSNQHSLKNFDLNDQPSFPNDSSDRSYLGKLSQNFDISGGIKSLDSVISLMGERVEVNRKDSVSQNPPLQNGLTPELAFDVNLGRSGNFLGIGSVIPYTTSSVFGPGPAMPYSSTYGSGGPIPYMVDSRGAPVIPQLMGSVFSHPPFVMNMTNSTPPNGLGPSRSTFDLNSGMLVESGSRDMAGFGQFLNSGQVRSIDEQLRSNGKRKEPDNGFEDYPFKHYTPPWK